jgi:hypothetical protein
VVKLLAELTEHTLRTAVARAAGLLPREGDEPARVRLTAAIADLPSMVPYLELTPVRRLSRY